MKTFICAPLALILLVLSACSNNDFQTQQLETQICQKTLNMRLPFQQQQL